MSNSEHLLDYETVEYHLIYSALINAARYRGTVTYQELAQMVGLPLIGSNMGKRLGKILGAVSQNEVQHQRPMLSALTVTVEGIPGPGFFTLARELGLLKSERPADEQSFWEEQTRRCYEIWQQKFHKSESK